MKNKCSQPDCIAATTGECHLGLELEKCDHWGKSLVATAAKEKRGKQEDTGGMQLVWSGLPLGLEDLTIIAARNKPRVVGVFGPHNAGKTTLLGMIYSHLWHGGRFGAAQFAGSYSFEGWENIAQNMRWSDDAHPHFPPHTELTEARVPGLLHLALRQTSGKLDDWLLTDAPGEWFKRWSLNENAPDAEGARWMAANSNIFLLLLDCDWLSGAERGAARTAYQNLINRLGSVRKKRPVAVVWSKTDKLDDEAKIAALQEYAAKVLSPFQEFRVSVKKEVEQNQPTRTEFERLFGWLNGTQAEEEATVSLPLLPPPASVASNDLMLSFRG